MVIRAGDRNARDFIEEQKLNNHDRTQKIYDHATNLVIVGMYLLFLSALVVALVLFISHLLVKDWGYFALIMEDIVKYATGGLVVFAVNHGMVRRSGS